MHTLILLGSIGLGWDLRNCISDKSPGDADVTHPKAMLGEPKFSVNYYLLDTTSSNWGLKGKKKDSQIIENPK